MRAVAEDPETAALMGVRRSRVSALAWGLAGALAAVAGLFITVFPSPGLEPVTATVALRAFPAAIIGGLDSTGGAVVGGLVVGVAEVLTQGYAERAVVPGARLPHRDALRRHGRWCCWPARPVCSERGSCIVSDPTI